MNQATVIQALSVISPCLYLALVFVHAQEFRGQPGVARSGLRSVLVIVAAASQVGLLLARYLSIGGVPSLGGMVFLTALGLAVTLMFESLGHKNAGPGASAMIVYALVFGLQFVSSAFAPLDVLSAGDRPALFYLLHVLTLLVASAALVLSGIHGLLYLLLFRQMRRRRFGAWLEGLPPLSELARRMRRAAAIAFVLLLVGLNGGIWWAHRASVEGFSYTDPFVLIMLGLLLHFGIVAFSRAIPGLTAHRAATGAAAGLFVLLASLAFSMLPQSFHWTT